MNNLLFLLTFLFMTCGSTSSQDVKLMTYNIRLDVASDNENAWMYRKDFLISQIQFYSPGILGVQEARPNQMDDLEAALSDYKYIGHGRDGGKSGEYSAIFYNATQYSMKESHTFWLSETPDVLSQGWDAAYPRICTYGLFEDKDTQQKFWVFNTHLDHMGKQARLNGVALIISKVNEINTQNFPVVLMGDLNVEPDSELITGLSQRMTDSESIAKISFGPDGTFNGFNYTMDVNRRIDYIFLKSSAANTVKKYAVLSASKNMKYPSDHFPVYIEVSFE